MREEEPSRLDKFKYFISLHPKNKPTKVIALDFLKLFKSNEVNEEQL